ncbi:MAG: hypothetical protein QNJ09_11310 [Paracoccaceae bacterium]|nr:hypothetical protein [Paracoccaceae bacterium]
MSVGFGIFDRALALLKFTVQGASEVRQIRAIRSLLKDPDHTMRSLETISNRIGLQKYKDSPDELRNLILIAGGVRFTGKDGTEFWGLPSRNRKPSEAEPVRRPRKLVWIVGVLVVAFGAVYVLDPANARHAVSQRAVALLAPDGGQPSAEDSAFLTRDYARCVRALSTQRIHFRGVPLHPGIHADHTVADRVMNGTNLWVVDQDADWLRVRYIDPQLSLFPPSATIATREGWIKRGNYEESVKDPEKTGAGCFPVLPVTPPDPEVVKVLREGTQGCVTARKLNEETGQGNLAVRQNRGLDTTYAGQRLEGNHVMWVVEPFEKWVRVRYYFDEKIINGFVARSLVRGAICPY